MLESFKSEILDLIRTKKSIHYTTLIKQFQVGHETARRYCVELASHYPKNLQYIRGLLILRHPFKEKDLPPNKRIKALSKTVKTQRETLKKKEKIEKKLRDNHISHALKALLKHDLEEVKKQLTDAMKLLE